MWESKSEVAQLFPTLCNPIDCSPPGSSIHGIFQARVLEWVAISFSNRYESWTIKKVFEEELMLLNCGAQGLLRVPWTARRSNQSVPKEISPEIFIGRTDAEAETLVLWSPDVKSQLIGKDLDARKGWRQEKEMTEDDTVRWHHRFNGHEFEQTLGDGEGQGRLACWSSWDCKKSDTTEWLNNNCDVQLFALEMNRDHSVIFEIVPKNCISDSLVDYEGYSISSKGFCAQ